MLKMNQKKAEKTKFSRLKLKSTASTSKKSFSPKPDSQEKISSYFTSSLPETKCESEELFESGSECQTGQRSKSVTNTKDDSLNDETDFDTRKLLKLPKVFEIKKESKATRKRTRNKNDLSRFVKDLGPSCNDTNKDNLQLALAMSKSIEEYENPGTSSQDSEYCSSYPSTQQKISAIKNTLDQFGFQSNRTPVELPKFKNNSRQKKRFKFITPTLFLRTEEDRAKLIETKVSTMLTNIATYNKYLEKNETQTKDQYANDKPSSFLLRDYYNEDRSIFRINHLNLSEMNDSIFYNHTVPKDIVKTGALLKDWRSIPGREKTPPIDIIVEETEIIPENEDKNNDKNKETDKLFVSSPTNRSISPELFSDSDTELSINKTQNKNLSYIEKSPDESNIYKSPQIISPQTINSETSPVIVIISSNSNKTKTPDISEKEVHSDDSGTISLSFLDNISPKRHKYKSPKKKLRNFKSPNKKCLFTEDKPSSYSLLDDITAIKNPKIKSIFDNTSPLECSSPLMSAENLTQICHYESFRDNSNDCFDLTRSSEDSNHIFDDDTVLLPKIRQDQNDVPLSGNLFSSETVHEMGEHDDHYSSIRANITKVKENEEFVDLTQSSNESNTLKLNLEKDANDLDETILLKYNSLDSNSTKNFEEIYSSSIRHEKSDQENDSGDSVKTVLLQKDFSAKIVEETEDINIVASLKYATPEESSPKSSVETVLLQENNFPSIVEETEEFGAFSSFKNTVSKDNSSKIISLNKKKSLITENNEKLPQKDFEIEETETAPLFDNILSPKKNLEYDYSPEFDILNSSNNREFYDSLNKTSLSLISESGSDNENEINTNKQSSNNKSILKTNNGTPNRNYAVQNISSCENVNKILKRSLSENIFDEKDSNKTNFFKLTSPLSMTNCFTQPCLRDINLEFEQNNDLGNISDTEKSRTYFNKNKKFKFRRKKNINDISKSSNDFESSDEELSSSVNKYRKSKLKKVEIDHINKSSNKIDSSDGEENNYISKPSSHYKSKEDNSDDSSQSSIDSNPEISDEELLYVSNRSFQLKKLDDLEDEIQKSGSSSGDENSDINMKNNVRNFMDFNDLPYTGLEPSLILYDSPHNKRQSGNLKHSRIQDLSTPKMKEKSLISETKTSPITGKNIVKTPENLKSVNTTPKNDFIIKTTDVTPMPDFNKMDTPRLKKELDKYGIRPLKRAKGIKILQYIYEATHPILEKNIEKTFKSPSDEEDNKIIKRRKKNNNTVCVEDRITENFETENIECIGNKIAESENLEDMIFERKHSKKTASCQLPLHIAWYNLVSSWKELHEKILLYEPIPVEQIYGKFKSFGYKFHIKDIIAFLDKKCVNVTTEQNEQRKIEDT